MSCLQVLRKRRGKTLNRRIILKSYLARAADPSLPPGTPDVRQAEGGHAGRTRLMPPQQLSICCLPVYFSAFLPVIGLPAALLAPRLLSFVSYKLTCSCVCRR